MKELAAHSLIYVGTPYSKYATGIESAFKDACWIAARLLKEGLNVYSPIAHTHPIAMHGGIDPLDHEIWLPFDEAIMAKADAMVVAMLPGWNKSKGVEHEILTFIKAGKPVYFINTEHLEIERRWGQ